MDIALGDLEEWYVAQTTRKTSNGNKKAKKQIRNIQSKITKLSEILSNHFDDDKIMTEAADAYRERILECRDILDEIELPSSYDTADVIEYKKNVDERLQEVNEIINKYGSLLVKLDKKSKKFETKIKNLASGLNQIYKQINNFEKYYDGDYSEVLEIHSFFDMHSLFLEVLDEVKQGEISLSEIKNKEEEYDSAILDLKEEMKELELHSAIVEYKEVLSMYESIDTEISLLFGDLKKALQKYLKAIQTRKIDSTDREKHIVKSMIKGAHTSFITEGITPSQTLEIMQKIIQNLENNKSIQMKKEKKDKLIQLYQFCKEKEFNDLYTRYREIHSSLKEKKTKLDELKIEEDLQEIERKIQNYELEKSRIRTSVERSYSNQINKREKIKKDIESKIKNVTGDSISLIHEQE